MFWDDGEEEEELLAAWANLGVGGRRSNAMRLEAGVEEANANRYVPAPSSSQHRASMDPVAGCKYPDP